ncbi:MAG: hypothetical protein Q4E52_08050 [Fibrobacter sp.]|nr:hypothetical protein [Fibrobacter sp.]
MLDSTTSLEELFNVEEDDSTESLDSGLDSTLEEDSLSDESTTSSSLTEEELFGFKSSFCDELESSPDEVPFSTEEEEYSVLEEDFTKIFIFAFISKDALSYV